MFAMRIGLCLIGLVLSGSLAHGDGSQLGARAAAEWVKVLDNPDRIAGLKIDSVVVRLGLRPGNVVADIGAGAGAFDGALAGAVGAGGTVYAVDIEQGLLDHIAARAKSVGIDNLKVVLGKFTDPNLPVRNVDVALICDVLHHIESREEYLKNLVGYLAPTGRVAIIDFLPGKGHANDSSQQITKEQTTEWMAAAGLKRVEEVPLFNDKFFVIYAK